MDNTDSEGPAVIPAPVQIADPFSSQELPVWTDIPVTPATIPSGRPAVHARGRLSLPGPPRAASRPGDDMTRASRVPSRVAPVATPQRRPTRTRLIDVGTFSGRALDPGGAAPYTPEAHAATMKAARPRRKWVLICISLIVLTSIIILSVLVWQEVVVNPFATPQEPVEPLGAPEAGITPPTMAAPAGAKCVVEGKPGGPTPHDHIVLQTITGVRLTYDPVNDVITLRATQVPSRATDHVGQGLAGVVPCDDGGWLLQHDECRFRVCPARFAPGEIVTRSLRMRADMLTTTCTGSDGHSLKLNGGKVGQAAAGSGRSIHSLRLPRGRSEVEWRCGHHLERRSLYTSGRASCGQSQMTLVCLNRHLRPYLIVATTFIAISIVDALSGMNVLASVLAMLYLPVLLFRTRKMGEQDCKTEMSSYHVSTSLCPLCGQTHMLLDEHLDRAHPDTGTRLTIIRKMRLKASYGRLALLARGASTLIALAALGMALTWLDTVGALSLDKLLPLKSTECMPVRVDSAAAISTTIENLTCTPAGCTGDTQLDISLRLVSGYAVSFKAEESFVLDVIVVKAEVVYHIESLYKTGAAEMVIAHNFKCTDSCETCVSELEPHTLSITQSSTGNLGCGCGSVNDGCTCAGCTPRLVGEVYDVGRADYVGTNVVLQFQAGGLCSAYSFDSTGLPNDVLFLHHTKGDRRTGSPIARSEGRYYSGQINLPGQFGAFGDIKFFQNDAIECQRDFEHSLVCHLTRNYLHVARCCTDTHGLRGQLSPILHSTGEPPALVEEIDDGVARLILIVPDTPVSRNPRDVTLSGSVTSVEGCYACGEGAAVLLSLTASGTGLFDVRTKGGKVEPSTLIAQAGAMEYKFVVFLGTSSGQSALVVGQHSFPFAYTLKGPADNVVGGGGLAQNLPVPCSGFFSCWSLDWGIPKWSTYALLTVFIMAGVGFALAALRVSWRFLREARSMGDAAEKRLYHKPKAV